MTTLLQPADHAAHLLQVPAHVTWSFNGIEFAPIDSTKPFTFNYTFNPATVSVIHPRTAVQDALRQFFNAARKPLAICLSGSDSEIMALEAAFIGVPFELFFLDIWGNNAIEQATAAEVATSLGKTLNVVSLDKATGLSMTVPTSFTKLQAAKPTYLVLPYLLERIPNDYAILGGEGDLEKHSPEYLFDSATQVPMSTTEVFYRQWALENNRDCDMYFFASTPSLIMSFLRHPLLERGPNLIDTRAVKDAVWPTLKYTTKTNNWNNVLGSNAEVVGFVRAIAPRGASTLPVICNVALS